MKKKYFLLLTLLSAFYFISINAQTLTSIEQNRVLLPNGWSLTPVGESLTLGDLPLNMAVSENKKLLAVTNNGQGRQSIQLIDVAKFTVLDDITIPKSWYGLKFNKTGDKLYASAGNDNQILQYKIVNNKLILADSFLLAIRATSKISPSGLDIDETSKHLFVVTKENNSLYVINTLTRVIEKTVPLLSESYACILSPDKQFLYISLWGAQKIAVYDVGKQKIDTSIDVGDHPNELLFSKNGKYLFAANANDNSVSVIDVQQKKVIETLNAALYPNSPAGSTTDGIALSEDQHTLYIANADNNCLAVFDIHVSGKSISKGFIPVGWYPTNVKVIGHYIYVSNGKGFKSMANIYGPNPTSSSQTVTRHQSDLQQPVTIKHIGTLFTGTVSKIKEPDTKQLENYSLAVYNNTPYTKEKEMTALGESGNPIPMKVGDKSPIANEALTKGNPCQCCILPSYAL